MANIVVSTTLEKGVYDAWKASGLKLNYLVRHGLMAAKQTPGYIDRIRELEEGNGKLQKKVAILMNRLNELERGAL